jgi:hypothetical protein
MRRHRLDREYLQGVVKLYSHVDENGCWLWTRSKHSSGYGILKIDYRQYRVPRLSLWAFGKLGELDDESVVSRHKMDICKSRACVNPDHLEIGTPRDNIMDSLKYGEDNVAALNSVKEFCKHGHLFDEGNTIYRHGNSGVMRECRTCRNSA